MNINQGEPAANIAALAGKAINVYVRLYDFVTGDLATAAIRTCPRKSNSADIGQIQAVTPVFAETALEVSRVEPELLLRLLGLGHQPADRLKKRPDLGIVTADLAFQVLQLIDQLFARGDDFTQPDKGLDDQYAHFNGNRAF